MATGRPISFRQVNRFPKSTTSSEKSLQTVMSERYSDLFRWKGARTLTTPSHELTRLLWNVNIESSLGAVQVVMSQEKSVRDLIKAAIEIYVKEKRRPLLKETTNPDRFELHYSQFCFESLKADEKLVNLGSRNFFLCLKPANSSSINSCCSEEAKKTTQTTSALTKLIMYYLL